MSNINQKSEMVRENPNRKSKRPLHLGDGKSELERNIIGSETEEDPFGASSSDEYEPPKKNKKIVYTAADPKRKFVRKKTSQTRLFENDKEVSTDKNYNFDEHLDEIIAQSNVERNEKEKKNSIEMTQVQTLSSSDILDFLKKIDGKLNDISARQSVMESTLFEYLTGSPKPTNPDVLKDENKEQDLFIKSNGLPTKSINELNRFERNLKDETFCKSACEILFKKTESVLGKNIDSAQKTLKAVMNLSIHRAFLAEFTWTGKSKGTVRKIPLQNFERLLNLLFDVVQKFHEKHQMPQFLDNLVNKILKSAYEVPKKFKVKEEPLVHVYTFNENVIVPKTPGLIDNISESAAIENEQLIVRNSMLHGKASNQNSNELIHRPNGTISKILKINLNGPERMSQSRAFENQISLEDESLLRLETLNGNVIVPKTPGLIDNVSESAAIGHTYFNVGNSVMHGRTSEQNSNEPIHRSNGAISEILKINSNGPERMFQSRAIENQTFSEDESSLHLDTFNQNVIKPRAPGLIDNVSESAAIGHTYFNVGNSMMHEKTTNQNSIELIHRSKSANSAGSIIRNHHPMPNLTLVSDSNSRGKYLAKLAFAKKSHDQKRFQS